MGTYAQGILGPFSGKVGSVVGSFWRGVYYMRALAPHVANPNTDAQKLARSLFGTASKVCRPFLTAIRKGFIAGVGESSWALAVKANMEVIAEGVPEEYVWPVNYSKLQLSNGTENANISVSAGRDHDYDLSWVPPTDETLLDGGQVIVVLYNKANNVAQTFRFEPSAGSGTVSDSGITVGAIDEIHVYAFIGARTTSTITQHFTFE